MRLPIYIDVVGSMRLEFKRDDLQNAYDYFHYFYHRNLLDGTQAKGCKIAYNRIVSEVRKKNEYMTLNEIFLAVWNALEIQRKKESKYQAEF